MKSLPLLLPLLGVFYLGTALAQTPEFFPIPLDPVANTALADDLPDDGKGGWTDQGRENSLTDFPTGDISLEGIPFVIPSEGPAAVLFLNPYVQGKPAKVSIPVADAPPARQLLVLSTTMWKYEPNEEAARMRLHFANGATREVLIEFEKQTGGWWFPSAPSDGVVAWRAHNGIGVPTGVYLAAIPLDETESPLTEINISVRRGRGIFALLGLTLSNAKEPLIVPQAAWQMETTTPDSWSPLALWKDLGIASVWRENPPASPAGSGRVLLAEWSPGLARQCLEDPEQASKAIRLTALLGYNGIRLPSLERLLPREGESETRGIRPEAAAGLETLLKEIQNAGLTLSLTLGGGRSYGIDDGLAAYRQINQMRADHYYLDPVAIGLLLDTLEHAARIPGISAATSATLLGEATLLTEYEDVLTPPHQNMLQNAWCAWLMERHASDEELVAAWQIQDAASPLRPGETLRRARIPLLHVTDYTVYESRFQKRFSDQLAFLYEWQKSRLEQLAQNTRDKLPGARLSGAVWKGEELVADQQTLPGLALDATEEMMGGSTITNSEYGPPSFHNYSPFLDDVPWFYRGAFNRVPGVPFTALENADAWPGDYEFTRLLQTMAFGAVQGWEGMVHRLLSRTTPPDALAAEFHQIDLLQNPAFLSILPLGRNLFLRGDLPMAPLVFLRPLFQPKDYLTPLENIHLPRRLQRLLYLGGVGAGPDAEKMISPEASAALNETDPAPLSTPGETLQVFPSEDRLLIRTDLSVAIAGNLNGKVETPAVRISGSGAYGVLYATSLDGAPLGISRSILLGATARARNTAQITEKSTGPQFKFDQIWRLTNTGEAPIRMEPIEAQFHFAGAPDGVWLLQPLNLLGQPLPVEPTRHEARDGILDIPLSSPFAGTTLFHLRHENAP